MQGYICFYYFVLNILQITVSKYYFFECIIVVIPLGIYAIKYCCQKKSSLKKYFRWVIWLMLSFVIDFLLWLLLVLYIVFICLYINTNNLYLYEIVSVQKIDTYGCICMYICISQHTLDFVFFRNVTRNYRRFNKNDMKHFAVTRDKRFVLFVCILTCKI